MKAPTFVYIVLFVACCGRRIQDDDALENSKTTIALRNLLLSTSALSHPLALEMRVPRLTAPSTKMSMQLANASYSQNSALPGLLILGLNPAWQTIIGLNKVDLGQVNRAEDARPGVGGKGQNAAKAAANWLDGKEMPFGVTVAQILGGATGDQIRSHLQKMRIADISVVTAAATRQTVTLLDYPDPRLVRLSRLSDSPISMPTVTEIITPGDAISSDAVADLIPKIVQSAPEHKGILLMGTWPSGVSKEVYAAVARAKADGALVLMDAFKPIEEVASILEEGFVDIYKVNAFEICTLMGGEDLKEGEVTLDQINDAVRRAFEKFLGVKHFAITDGASDAFLFSRDGAEAFSYKIPQVTCLNPIGAGDTVAGVLMAALCSGDHTRVQDAMLSGLAAGVAKVQNEDEGGLFAMQAFLEARDLIECTPFQF